MKISPLFYLLILLFLIPASGLAASPPQTFSVDVPAGQWKTIRLKELPKDMAIRLAMTSDGIVGVGFLTALDHRQFPRMTQPLFWGQAESKLGFSVTITQAGDYYVIVDNREGMTLRHVTLTAHATLRGTAAEALIAHQLQTIERQLKALVQKLNQTFAFEPMPIHVRTCAQARPFERHDGLTLCLQYARHLMDAFQDKTIASDALVYSMFQEIAESFRSQWGLDQTIPQTDLDELTTVLMLTFRLDANLRSYSQTILNQPHLSAPLPNATGASTHPLSTERAERVLKWTTDPGLVKTWQPRLVPHMQTHMLQHLKAHPQPWSDSALIEQELATRPSGSNDSPSTHPKGKLKT